MKLTKKILLQETAFTSILSLAFVFFAINTELIYNHQQIAWKNSTTFLNYYFSFAGGPGEYITLFITQFFYKNLLGSLIVAIILYLISYLLNKLIEQQYESFSVSYFLILLSPIVLVGLMSDYNYHFSITINLFLISVILFLCDLAKKILSIKSSYYILIGGILVYYVSGGVYYLIFILSSLILNTNKLNRKSLIEFLIVIIIAGLLPYIANKFVFLSSLKMSYFRAFPEVAVMLRYSKPVLFYIGLGMIPLIFIINVIENQILFKRTSASKNENGLPKTQTKIFGKISLATAGFVIEMVIWTGLAITILYSSYNPADKKRCEVEYLAHLGKWNTIIDLSRKIDEYDRMVNFQYNRALLHTGKLLDDLFDYEQLLGSGGLFLDIPLIAEVALPNSDLYFDLGNIDESLRLAFEAQTLMPNSPQALERLAQSTIIRGKNNAAYTFLNVLAENPMERSWVKTKKKLLDNPENLKEDAIIAEKINFMDKAEGIRLTPRDKMLSLLQHNPNNKNAFEYLIAFDLMEHDLPSFVEDMAYFSNFDYKKTPKIIEEAVLIFLTQRPDNNFLKNFKISPETIERLRGFASITRSNDGNREKAKQAAYEFKDTYWYFMLFLSPVVTKVKIETRPAETNY